MFAAESRTIGADLYSRGAPHTSDAARATVDSTCARDFVPDESVEDPADLIRGFRPQRPAVRRIGTTTVRGVHTTHYRHHVLRAGRAEAARRAV